jgi:DNA-binding NtrC family response regulator
MQPMGVHAHIASTAKDALSAAREVRFHAAVVDLATPVGSPTETQCGGLWLLKVLRRSEHRTPIVVVNSHATQRQAVRLLNDALRLGAFSVVNRPVRIDALLGVIAKLLDRNYQGQWPSSPTMSQSQTQAGDEARRIPESHPQKPRPPHTN